MVDKKDVILPPERPRNKTWQETANWTINQNWTWHDVWHWDLQVREALYVSDRLSKASEKPLKDSFSIAHKKQVFEYSLSKQEKVRFVDAMKTSSGFYRDYYEAIKMTCVNGNHYSMFKSDSFNIYDTLLRAGHGVFSDIMFEDASKWTMDEMKNYMFKGRHVGFETFRPFIYGDYTYKDALFRTAIDAVSADRALLEQFQIAVDVPDIVDRGAAEVVDKNFDLRVNFNKFFNNAPEVTVTMRAGSSAKPVVANITGIDEKGFTVHLINALTGEKTEGRFIWTAVGY